MVLFLVRLRLPALQVSRPAKNLLRLEHLAAPIGEAWLPGALTLPENNDARSSSIACCKHVAQVQHPPTIPQSSATCLLIMIILFGESISLNTIRCVRQTLGTHSRKPPKIGV